MKNFQLWLSLFAILLNSCSSTPEASNHILPPPATLQPVPLSDIRDDRGNFRQIVCHVAEKRKGLYPDERSCSNILHDLGGEPASSQDISKIDSHVPATVLIVPGIFGECVQQQVTPFSDGRADDKGQKVEHPYAYLEQLGYSVQVVPSLGRASSEVNSAPIKDMLLQLSASTKPIIIVAYSKGISDTLEALEDLGSENIPQNLLAVVSVAGVVSGTPIADHLGSLYNHILEKIPFPTCSPAQSDPIASLSRYVRSRKLSDEIKAIPPHVRLYSLAAFTEHDQITDFLQPFYAMLSVSDPRNDGQIIYYDAVLPHSHLLGYVNSDHWALALAFNRSDTPFWRKLINHNAFPREVLLESILSQVEIEERQ